MSHCPTCNYSWPAHDERDAQRCYGQWRLRKSNLPPVRISDLRGVEASPAWEQAYVAPRYAA